MRNLYFIAGLMLLAGCVTTGSNGNVRVMPLNEVNKSTMSDDKKQRIELREREIQAAEELKALVLSRFPSASISIVPYEIRMRGALGISRLAALDNMQIDLPVAARGTKDYSLIVDQLNDYVYQLAAYRGMVLFGTGMSPATARAEQFVAAHAVVEPDTGGRVTMEKHTDYAIPVGITRIIIKPKRI